MMKDDETDVPTSVKFCVDTKLQPVHETAFYPYFTCWFGCYCPALCIGFHCC